MSDDRRDGMVEDDRQVKDARGKWRRVQDECSEADYIARRKEKTGFRNGARIGLRYKGITIVFDGAKS